MTPLVLSCFPGIGLLDMAFELEGFCVVRGPDLLWGGDVHRFHPPAGRFDGVIGGPPCQTFSRLRHLVEHNGYKVAENLIPEYERVVAEAAPRWFVMENVPQAPLPRVAGYAVSAFSLNNRWVGGVQNRERVFSFGSPEMDPLFIASELAGEMVLLERAEYAPAVLASGSARPVGGSGKRKKSAAANLGYKTAANLAAAIRHQGLPDGFLEDAPFTVAGKIAAVGNGVPLPLGRAVARAVKRAIGAGTASGDALGVTR